MTEMRPPSKFWRILAMVLMSLTVFFTLAGGIGTTCVAFGAEKYESMAKLVPYKTLYQVLVVLSLAAAIWGIPVLIGLVRGGRHVYRNAVLNLLLGAITSGVQTAVSQSVRGSSAPVNMRFGITLITLILFLLFRLPALWQRVDFTKSIKGNPKNIAGGLAFVLCGALTLTMYQWVGLTHLQAWIDVLRWPIFISGCLLLVAGFGLLMRSTPAPSSSAALQRHPELS